MPEPPLSGSHAVLGRLAARPAACFSCHPSRGVRATAAWAPGGGWPPTPCGLCSVASCRSDSSRVKYLILVFSAPSLGRPFSQHTGDRWAQHPAPGPRSLRNSLLCCPLSGTDAPLLLSTLRLGSLEFYFGQGYMRGDVPPDDFLNVLRRHTVRPGSRKPVAPSTLGNSTQTAMPSGHVPGPMGVWI